MQIEVLTRAFKNEKAKRESTEKELTPTEEKMASMAKKLNVAKKEKADVEAISMQLKAKLQSMEEKLAQNEKARVNAIAMVGKSDKLYRDLIILKKPSKFVVTEQNPEVAALTEALNKKLQ